MSFRTVIMTHPEHGSAIVEDDPKVVAVQEAKGYRRVPELPAAPAPEKPKA